MSKISFESDDSQSRNDLSHANGPKIMSLPNGPFRKLIVLLFLSLIFFTPVETFAKKKSHKPFFLFVMHPELQAPHRTPEGKSPSLVLQNGVADSYDLPRIQNSTGLHMLEEGELPYLVNVDRHIACFLVDQHL